MEKLKCSSCGGEITIDDDKEYGTCPYCGTKYKLNEDINFNIKMDDNTKEVLTSGAKHFSKFLLIPVVLFVFVFVSIVIFGFISSSKADKRYQERVKQQQEEANKFQEQVEKIQDKVMDKIEESKEEYKKSENEWDKDTFNMQFFGDNGTRNAIFVKNTLDDIIKSNKTYDKKITLVFDGREVTDESEIISIKQSLSGDYEVSLDYDSDGYINKVTVRK